MQQHIPLTPAIWSDRPTVAAAGVLTYLAHLALPDLVAVEARSSHRFTDGKALHANGQRTALLMMQAMGADPAHPAGMDDPAVERRLRLIGEMHTRISIPEWQMIFITAMTVIAPCWVVGVAYADADASYHKAAHRLAGMMGAPLMEPALLERWVRDMIETHTAATELGRQGYQVLADIYPDHLAQVAALPMLPRRLVDLLAMAGLPPAVCV